MKGLLSIIVCTYNRAESLKDTLTSLGRQQMPAGMDLEIIAVDNNSKDHTPDVVKKAAGTSAWPLRYVFEGEQGLSHARNRGLSKAEGEWIAFTDDDVVADEHWAAALHAALVRESASCAGGRILPQWETPPPAWLQRNLLGNLALVDHGDEPLAMEEKFIGTFLYGASMAYTREVFTRFGGFNTELGRKGNVLLCGEETDLMKRIFEGGGRIVYVPEAVVHHKIPKERMQLSYFQRWNFHYGRSIAFMENGGRRIPVWLAKECVQNAAAAAWAYARRLEQEAVRRQLLCFFQLGQMAGRLSAKPVKTGV
jgi:glucosyl-dolichyl phosphate glucuronosyltransferase